VSYTSGPWFVGGVRQKIDRREALGIFWYDETKKLDENIASVWYDPRNGVGSADARLIAAAPDLLAALQRFVAAADHGAEVFHDLKGSCLRDAREALAKAEGRP
jgi:hypothetical protein